MPVTTNVVLNTNEIREISRLITNRVFSRDATDQSIVKADRDLIDTKVNATILEVEDAINTEIESKIDGAITRLMTSEGGEEEWW